MPVAMDLFERLDQRLNSYRDEMIQFQKELTAVVALGPDNGGQGEWARAHFLREKIESFGLTDFSEYHAEDQRVPEGTRPNFVVRLAGEQAHPAVWVMAHMDIVPPGDENLWDTKPHEAVAPLSMSE